MEVKILFKNLLVPVDGSTLAESALPWAWWLAHHTGATVALLHVIERHAPRLVHGEPHLSDVANATSYLEGLVGRRPAGVSVQTHVHTVPEGDVAGSIARHTHELGTDLVVLSTHGRPGVRGLLLGSIGQQVLRQALNPVLLARPGSAPPREPGSALCSSRSAAEEAEKVLPAAAELARRTHASLRLLYVVPTLGTVRGDQTASARVSPLATTALLDAQQERAVEYARGIVEDLRSQGMDSRAEVVRGDAVEAVCEAARKPEVGLVAMASHGHSASPHSGHRRRHGSSGARGKAACSSIQATVTGKIATPAV
ncbi:MAG: universal stress protein [Chloroflexia bacterium]